MFQTPASLLHGDSCVHLVHCSKCQQWPLTWPESLSGACQCQPPQGWRKTGFTPCFPDCGYQRIVHHHLYEIYLNLVGRILLKHLLILSAQLPKSSGLSFADLSFRPALTTKQSMHAARMWLEKGHFSCSLLPWCNLTCPRRFSHTLGCQSDSTLTFSSAFGFHIIGQPLLLVSCLSWGSKNAPVTHEWSLLLMLGPFQSLNCICVK